MRPRIVVSKSTTQPISSVVTAMALKASVARGVFKAAVTPGLTNHLGLGVTSVSPFFQARIGLHLALEQVILPPYSPLSNWPRKKRSLLFAISHALAYTDSLRNRDEWRSLPRMVAPAIF